MPHTDLHDPDLIHLAADDDVTLCGRPARPDRTLYEPAVRQGVPAGLRCPTCWIRCEELALRRLN